MCILHLCGSDTWFILDTNKEAGDFQEKLSFISHIETTQGRLLGYTTPHCTGREQTEP